MPEQQSKLTDWAGDTRTFALLWGLPTGAILLTAFVDPSLRAVVWTAMLLWMGGACLANARRCSRTHCKFTGPYFIVMAAGVIAFATGLLALGKHGWLLLGGSSLIGAVGLWWTSERIWGRFTQ